MKERFTIETNPIEPADMNFRNVVLNIGSSSSETSREVSAIFMSPPGSFYTPIQVKQPGQNTSGTTSWYVASSGYMVSNVGERAGLAWAVGTAGEPNSRFQVTEWGNLEWGPGKAAPVDTNLYRAQADVLKTDDMFVTQVGLGVGNAAPASVPGTVVRKMEVFDADGRSLGFIPIYDRISKGD